jgi:hypothetical protein
MPEQALITQTQQANTALAPTQTHQGKTALKLQTHS